MEKLLEFVLFAHEASFFLRRFDCELTEEEPFDQHPLH